MALVVIEGLRSTVLVMTMLSGSVACVTPTIFLNVQFPRPRAPGSQVREALIPEKPENLNRVSGGFANPKHEQTLTLDALDYEPKGKRACAKVTPAAGPPAAAGSSGTPRHARSKAVRPAM